MAANEGVKISGLFAKNYKSQKRVVVNEGGSSSGKTYCLCQLAITKCLERPNTLFTVTASNFPTLRKGALRDFQVIVSESPFNAYIRQRTASTYTLYNGSVIQFAIFPNAIAAKYGKRNFLFINEADGVRYSVAQNLILRTTEQVYLDFNPTQDFWVHEVFAGRTDVDWIHSTYRDNPFVSDAIVKEIEDLRRTDPELYKVYGLGLKGALTGQVFPNVQWVEEMSQYFEDWVYCMDIGFSNSFTTLAKVGIANGMMYGQEMLYQRGLNDREIADKLTDLGIQRNEKIVIDSANAMLIDYLREEYGFFAVPCKKRDVVSEISAMKRYKWNITLDSVNWRKEQKNYIYSRDKDNSVLNAPVKAFDHLWDAARYGFLELVDISELPRFL